jgi:hypothetical protein
VALAWRLSGGLFIVRGGVQLPIGGKLKSEHLG